MHTDKAAFPGATFPGLITRPYRGGSMLKKLQQFDEELTKVLNAPGPKTKDSEIRHRIFSDITHDIWNALDSGKHLIAYTDRREDQYYKSKIEQIEDDQERKNKEFAIKLEAYFEDSTKIPVKPRPKKELKDRLESLKRLKSFDYIPPDDPKALLFDLESLYRFFDVHVYRVDIPPIVLLKLLSESIRLIKRVVEITSQIHLKDGPTDDRTASSTITKRLNEAKRIKKVYALFKKRTHEKGDAWTDHGVSYQAKRILDDLKAEGMADKDLPGHSTIRRDIGTGKKEGLI